MGNSLTKLQAMSNKGNRRNRRTDDELRASSSYEPVRPRDKTDDKSYDTLQYNTYAEISNQIREELFVAAMDFGTSASGYALSFYNEYIRDPLTIHSYGWPSKSDGFLHHKNLTAVLLNPEGKFDSFGYDAEWKYTNLDEDQHTHWYFFQHFKMELFKDKDLSRNSVIHDVHGKSWLALDIFAHAIAYLKGHLMSKLQAQMHEVSIEDIFWVLTVPAIWSERAKQFMRLAAHQGGIPESKLAIALEPEVAALYCRQLPVSKQAIYSAGDRSHAFKPGSRYLVVDLGGGTVDITAHAIRDDGALEELMAATGGDWGSNYVNEEFIQYFENVTIPGILGEMQRLYPDDYVVFMASFENKKRVFSLTDEKINIAFPSTLRELLESRLEVPIQTHFQNAGKTDDISQKRDKLTLSGELFTGFLNACIDKLVLHIMGLLVNNDENMKISSIILVGGFAECPVLKEKVKNVFSEYFIIIPHEPVLSVLKGAVLFGRNPRILHARVCRYTYGICVNRKFIAGQDPSSKLVVYDNREILTNVFRPHIFANQVIRIGELLPCTEYSATSNNLPTLQLSVYATQNKDPKFVTDPDVQYLGQLILDIPPHCKTPKFMVRFLLDGTELEVSVMEVTTGQEGKGKFNFLG